MKKIFRIQLAMKVVNDYEVFGSFSIGQQQDVAETLFSQLAGDTEVRDEYPLLMELVEMQDGIPLNLKVLGCSLSELTLNCQKITCEIFRRCNIEEDKDLTGS